MTIVYDQDLDYGILAASGQVGGVSSVNKFGGGFESAADTPSDVWDNGATNTIYDFPATATITHVRAAVDSATTQGMDIEVQGLDANWNLVVQNATLDGTASTTEVALTTALLRVFRVKVIDNLVADQDIWAGATGMAAATISALVQAGNNQTLMAIYTVPANKTAYMTGVYASVVDATNKTPTSTDIVLWAADRANSYEFQIKFADAVASGASGVQHKFYPYYKFTEKTDIKIQTTCANQPGKIYGGFDLILLDN